MILAKTQSNRLGYGSSGIRFSTFGAMDIDEWRMRIDALTDEIIALLNKRAEFATKIGLLKKEHGLPVFDAAREKSVLDAVAEKASQAGGPLSPESVQKIFQVIMEETRKVEE